MYHKKNTNLHNKSSYQNSKRNNRRTNKNVCPNFVDMQTRLHNIN